MIKLPRFAEYRIFRYLRPYIFIALAAVGVDAVVTAATGALTYQTKPVQEVLRMEVPAVASEVDGVEGVSAEERAQFQQIRYDRFLRICWLMAGLTLTVAFFEYGKIYLKRYVAFKVDYDLRSHLCEHLMGLSLGFFNDKRNGELLSNMTHDISNANHALMLAFDVANGPVRIATAVIYSYILHPLLAVAMLAMMPFIYLPSLKLRKKIRKASGARLSRLADLTQAMTQILTGIRTVKSFRMEEDELTEFRHLGRRVMSKAMRATRAKAMNSSLTALTSHLGSVVILLAVGTTIIFRGQALGLGVDDLITFILFASTAYHGAKSFAKDYAGLQEYLPASERLFKVFDVKSDIEDHPDAVPLLGVTSGVTFKDVEFGYDNNIVLHNINLHVPAGSIVAVVGHSGAGKSTLLDLIPRFYDPQKGSVCIDGIDIRSLTGTSLLQAIAIVGQQPFLFATTIGENIRYGRRNATDEEVFEAARAANIHDFIINLPEGYKSRVGEQGVRLSGGQRQRITIARAILRNAPILILDEATSSLDSESEKLVQDALENLMQNRTTFVVAHRLSTVQHADMIVVLKDGTIVEKGVHGELLTRNGEYARLHNTQFRTETKNGD